MEHNPEINGMSRCSIVPDDCPPSTGVIQDAARSRRLTKTALHLLLKRSQITGFLVNHQHCLVAIYCDPLGLFKAKTQLSQDITSVISESLQAPIAEVLQQTTTADEVQYDHHCKEPSPCTYTITASFHTDDHDGQREFIIIFVEQIEDIAKEDTDRMAAALAENKYLRAQVIAKEKTEQELAQQARSLTCSNADLEEFAYVISHDLQEPLRAMTAFSQLLQQRYEPQLDTTAQRYIKHIVAGGIRMKAMIDGILELSRINNAQQSRTSATDLKQALDTALDNLNIMCLETQATITQTALPMLYVDQNHSVQLFQNLISNAIKFRSSAPPHIHVSAEPYLGKWLFKVHDNGIGIPHRQQKRIFKLFQRLHNEQEQKGYGIGLAICKKIVEHYQGEIWLNSSPGKGSTVCFTLVAEVCAQEA